MIKTTFVNYPILHKNSFEIFSINNELILKSKICILDLLIILELNINQYFK